MIYKLPRIMVSANPGEFLGDHFGPRCVSYELWHTQSVSHLGCKHWANMKCIPILMQKQPAFCLFVQKHEHSCSKQVYYDWPHKKQLSPGYFAYCTHKFFNFTTKRLILQNDSWDKWKDKKYLHFIISMWQFKNRNWMNLFFSLQNSRS